MKILVKPLDGVYWEDKNILLGEKRENVEKTFPNIDLRDKIIRENGLSFYHFNSNLRVDFDKDERVEFIEFLGGFNIGVQVEIYGVEVFKTNADELVELLKKLNNGEIEDSENGYCYKFKNIGVGIYRESTPESLVDFIEEIRNDKSINEVITEENIREEILKTNYWETLGIGVKGYYQ